MSKLVTISAAALAATLTLTAVPATAQRHPGPSDLRDADRQPQTAIAIPALIRSRAEAEPPAPDAAAGKVKVFDGAGQPDIRAAAEPTSTAKATLYGRKAGDDKRLDAQPEGDEAAAARMQSSNNLKQVGLANH